MNLSLLSFRHQRCVAVGRQKYEKWRRVVISISNSNINSYRALIIINTAVSLSTSRFPGWIIFSYLDQTSNKPIKIKPKASDRLLCSPLTPPLPSILCVLFFLLLWACFPRIKYYPVYPFSSRPHFFVCGRDRKDYCCA